MVFFLAALTVRLFNRVLGADDAPFGAVRGKRGDAGAAAGTATPGVGSSSTTSGVTTVAASASETPKSLFEKYQAASRLSIKRVIATYTNVSLVVGNSS